MREIRDDTRALEYCGHKNNEDDEAPAGAEAVRANEDSTRGWMALWQRVGPGWMSPFVR